MKTLYTFVAFWLMVLAIGCSAHIDVRHDYDTETDFATLRTFDWLPISAEARKHELIVRYVRNAVNRELEAKGLRMTSEDPDFLVAIHGGKQEITEITYRRVRAGRAFFDTTEVDEYEVGTLILDFVDAKTKELIWRGSASGVIDPDRTPEEREKRINEAVRKILENFPPVL